MHELYGAVITSSIVQIQRTNPEFEGDFTLVTFPLLKMSRKSPEETAMDIAGFLSSHLAEVSQCNIIKGFLNISLTDACWVTILADISGNENFGHVNVSPQRTIVVEYSSPNTNKPLHLGHIRNNLLGSSIAHILAACGHRVVKVNLVNDRGIHICKSMLAWMKWGNGQTPGSTGQKGDHLVGDYYVKFDQEYKKEVEQLVAASMPADEAAVNAPLMIEAQKLLQRWETGDQQVVDLWKQMNGWVYEGFDETYKKLGVRFDKIYYESETYLSGKQLVADGLSRGIFFKKDDGSVWVDLTGEGLDQKVLLRSDGTSVYITQDIGTAHIRYNEYQMDEMIYVVGNEQNYHFQVLRQIIKKLGYPWADKLYHLSYGMVELPEGKMKSREGTVVDADDLMDEMINTAREMSMELGKLDNFSDVEKEEIFRIIGLGALKYFILKVDPKKNMTFNPAESIDFNGNTGPFIQYTFARIQSLLSKARQRNYYPLSGIYTGALLKSEREIIKTIYYFPAVVKDAAESLSPALVANYAFELVKQYNHFYQDTPVLHNNDEQQVRFRLLISDIVARTIFSAMQLLGIEMPERM